MDEYTKILRGKNTPVTPGTIRKYIPADFPELSSNDEELPEPQGLRLHACDTEEVTTLTATSQPSWADLHPELTTKSSGGRVEDLPVVKAYREDLATRERPEKRKAEEVTAATLKALKRKSFLSLLKSRLSTECDKPYSKGYFQKISITIHPKLNY